MDVVTGKKWVIFSETYLPLFGGAEMYTHNFARQLADRGGLVTIVTHTPGLLEGTYEIPKVTVERVPKITKRNVLKAVSLFALVSRRVRENDCVCANYTYAFSTMTVLAAKLHGKPVTVFAHGLGTIIDESHPMIYRVYRSITLRLAARVIATSEEIAAIVRQYNKNVLVATAVDFSHVDNLLERHSDTGVPNPHEGKKTLLTIRRLVEKNGIQYLIEALPWLVTIRQDFVCLIAGDGRLREQLEARVRILNLSSYVHFLGSVENDRVFGLIRSAHVVIFPSSAEALSLAAIECMHIGTPVLVSDIGGLRELVGTHAERGTVIDLFGRSESVYTAPQSSDIPLSIYEEFARRIDMILRRPPEIVEKAQRAKTFVDEHFDWDAVVERIIEFIATKSL